MQDVKLIWLWEKWKQSIADELACDAVAADRAHARTQAIEREIAETRAEGLVGIGIQFGLWRFINGHFILGCDQADAAYEALVRLTGKGLYCRGARDCKRCRDPTAMNLGVELNAAESPGSRGVQGTRGGDCAEGRFHEGV